MKQRLPKILLPLLLCVLLKLFNSFIAPVYAKDSEEHQEAPTSPIAPQVNQLLGTISKLTDTNEKKEHEEKKESEIHINLSDLQETIKILNTKKDRDHLIAALEKKENEIQGNRDDLQETIRILNTKKDRNQLIMALKGLANVHDTSTKKENVIETGSLTITKNIEASAHFFLNAVAFLGQAPGLLMHEVSLLANEEYRVGFFILLATLIISTLVGYVVEFLTRRLLKWLKIRRPKVPSFKKLPLHVLRNVTPIILFGLVGYGGIYFSQGGWTSITSRGFIAMTIIIMVRTSWLVLRVLFSSSHARLAKGEVAARNSTYQFVLALLQIITIGIVFAQISAWIGLGQIAHDVWLRIIGFGVVSLLVIMMSKQRLIGANFFIYDIELMDGWLGYPARIIEFLGEYWHWFVSLGIIASYTLWLTKFDILARSLFSSLILTIILTILFIYGRRALTHILENLQSKVKGKESDITASSIRYLEGSLGKGILFVWHILYFLLLTEAWGAEPIRLLTSPQVQPYLTQFITIIITLFIIRVLWLWVDYIIANQMKPRKLGKREIEPSQFIKTLMPIIRSLAHWALTLMAAILILSELKVNVTPLFFGAGVIAFAVSWGSQSLVKDLINGFLNLMEGNVVVGEVITIGNFTGTVESLSLRSLSLRHSNGSLQNIPFSEVNSIINKSRNYTSVPIEISVPFHTDIGAVHKVLLSAYSDICKDPVFGRLIIDPLTISGIEKFSDNGFVISGTIKVRPDPKAKFLKAFNNYLKARIEQDNILPPASSKVVNINIEPPTESAPIPPPQPVPTVA